MLQSIELFSGSGEISLIFQSKGFHTLTVDNNPKLKPDLCIDICELSADILPGSVALFWASPDCTRFSRAAAQKHWTKETISYRNYNYTPATAEAIKAEKLLIRTVQLIQEINPGVWFIENPVGRMPHLPALRNFGHYRYCVNYADWGFSYGKETYIFTNQLLPLPTKVQKRFLPGLRSVSDKSKRSLIPAGLIHFLVDHSSF